MKDKHGILTSSVSNRGDGRKIDTLTYRADAPGGMANKSHRMEFDVYLLPDHSFCVRTKDIPSDRWTTLKGRVLEDLAAQAEEAAREEFNLQANLTWSPWLEVKVTQASKIDLRGAEGGASAHVSYRSIQKGVFTDGREFTPGNNGSLLPFPTNANVVMQGERDQVGNDMPDDDMANLSDGARIAFQLGRCDRRPTNEQYTYLPDTPQARAGLDSIIAAIDTINGRLQAFLQPGEIGRTLELAAQSGLRMLSAPEVNPTPSRATKGPR